jgi:hypothetical protein
MSRPLTSAELDILQIARDHLGPQNTEHDVFFTDDGGAAIFAKSQNGSPCIMLHLTNLSEFIRDGQMTRAQVVQDIEDGCGHGAA